MKGNAMQTDPLISAQRLRPDDLTANRRGALSEHQRNALSASQMLALGLTAAALMIITGIMAVAALTLDGALVVIAVFAVPLWMVVRFGRYLLRTYPARREELRTMKVASVTGVAAHIHTNRDYNLMVEDVPLAVQSSLLAHIAPGGRYRAYYLPRTKLFIGIERA